MNVVKVSDTAKSVLNGSDYNILMGHINNRKMNNARVFIEDKIDNIIFSTNLESVSYRHEKIMRLKEIDAIITDEIINNIKVNGTTTISK